MKQNKEEVQSPCIENCKLNDEKICLGCFRTIEEIVQWQEMDDKLRREVLHKTESRRKAYDLKRES